MQHLCQFTCCSFIKYLTIIIILISYSCRDSEFIPEISTKPGRPIGHSEWTTLEQIFFDLNNDTYLLGSNNRISTRSDYFPEVLINVYEDLIVDNEQDSFVYAVSSRIGFPIWSQAQLEDARDSLPNVVYVPFVQHDSAFIAGYLIGYLAKNAQPADLKLDIRLRYDILQMVTSEESINSNTCHDLMRFIAFDSLLFGSSSVVYDSLLCKSCAGSSASNLTTSALVNRSCIPEEVVLCYWADDGQSSGAGVYNDNGQYINWTITSTPFSSFCCNSNIYFWGGFYGSLTSGAGANWNAWWYRMNSSPKLIPRAISGPDIVSTRTFTYQCAPFVLIRCFNGEWWELVLSLPCDGCNIDSESEYAEDVFCGQIGVDFAEGLGLQMTDGYYKPAVLAARSCCKLDDFDEGCAVTELINTLGGFNIDNNNEYSGMNECETELAQSSFINSNCAWSIYANMKAALAKELEVFGMAFNDHNGCGDAFRHAYFNTLNTISCGKELAKLFGDAHECDTPPERISEKYMDFHNNDIGYAVGQAFLDGQIYTSLAEEVCARLAAGELVILEDPEDGTSNLIDSDGCHCL